MDDRKLTIPLPIAGKGVGTRGPRTSRLAAAPALVAWWDAVPGFLLALDQQGRIAFANKSICQFLGVARRDELYGQRFGDVVECPHAFPAGCGNAEACRDCGIDRATVAIKSGHPEISECRLARSADGQAMDLRITTTPIEVGGEPFIIMALTDISDEKRRQALERIFFHDLLNTAGAVLGYADLLAQVDPQEIPELGSSIARLTAGMVDEIRAQQQLAAAERHDLAVHWEPVGSRDILESVAESYRGHPTAEGRIIALDASCPDTTLTSDKVLLARVLGNMVKNALEASQPGQAVTLGCHADETHVEFWVHNAGTMPLEAQHQVFQRSFSTKGVGRGLGTYSIRLLSERYLHGSVSFTTSAAKGTIFRARYPRHQ